MPAAYGLGPLATLLPVRSATTDNLPQPDAGAGPAPAAQRILPGLTAAWGGLPTLPWWVRSTIPRPGADVVLSMHDQASSPLLVCAERGAGRVAWLGSDQLWRWRAQGDVRVHAAVWLRLARWGLGARLSGNDRQLQAALDLTVAVPGQTVGLRLRSLDPSGAPAAAPQTLLERVGADGRLVPGSRRELALIAISDQPGTWSTSVNDPQRPLLQGRWRLSAGTAPGPSESRELLVRSDPGREVLEPALDRAALDRLAAATGGQAVGLDGIETALATFSTTLESRTVMVRHRWTMWDGPWWLLALTAVLAAEWAWRRRLGLP